MNIKSTFQFKKVRKMQNLGNVYIWGSPFVMSRTDAQNGVDIIFKVPCFSNYVSFLACLPTFINCNLKTNIEKGGKGMK